MSQSTLYERLGGSYAIASAVDYLVDRLHTNATLNKANAKVDDLHTAKYKAGYKFMVTARSIGATGGPNRRVHGHHRKLSQQGDCQSVKHDDAMESGVPAEPLP